MQGRATTQTNAEDTRTLTVRVRNLAGRPERYGYSVDIILDNSATVGSLPFGVNVLMITGIPCDSCLVRSSSETRQLRQRLHDIGAKRETRRAWRESVGRMNEQLRLLKQRLPRFLV
jgi:hypothetical protein